MSEKNLFEIASRTRLRFPSNHGDLNLELIWDLPLTTDRPNVLSLDALAKLTAARLRALSEDSFVNNAPNPIKATEELRLELIKHIIAVKIDERDKVAAQAKLRSQQAIISGELAKRQGEELSGLSTEELQKQNAAILAQLGQ